MTLKTTDFDILEMVSALNRLTINKIDSKTRYATTRNLQTLRPLLQAAIEAFPETPKESESEYKAWVEQLKKNDREFQPFLFKEIPDFSDDVYGAEQNKSDPGITDSDIQALINRQNQAIMQTIFDLIEV